jgi:hypothetical protein
MRTVPQSSSTAPGRLFESVVEGGLSRIGSAFSGLSDARRQVKTVPLFDGAHIHAAQGGIHKRKDVEVDLPAGDFERITLDFELSGPEGRTDHWDRPGKFVLVSDDGTEVELGRFMTPYRVGGRWSIDLTHAAPLLRGKQTLRVKIDTGVGPGVNEDQGLGWLVDARLKFEPGKSPSKAVATTPLNFGTVWYGNPDQPTAREAVVDVPVGARNVSVQMLITGHGQGNLDNAAEWARKRHTVTVDGKPYSREIWRDDCQFSHGVVSDNPRDPDYQYSPSYKAARAGWCPGDTVDPWVLDLGPLPPGKHVIRYEPEAYENTCSPDYFEEHGEVVGCTLGAPPEYNGRNHTLARYEVSGLVTVYT